VLGAGRPSPPTVRQRWTFAPRGDPPAGRDDLARWGSRLDDALRAGHGIGATIVVRFRSGPEAPTELEAEGSTTVRWFERALAPVYDPGQWTRDPRAVATGHGSLSVARRRLLPGEMSGPGGEPGRVARTTRLALSTLPAGIELACRLRPTAGRPARPVGRAGATVLPAASRAHGPGAGSAPRPLPLFVPTGSDGGPLWSAQVEIRTPVEFSPAERRRADAGAESAWIGLDGGGITLQGGAIARAFAPRFLLTTAEVAAVLPPKDARPLGSPNGGAEGEGLPLGRTVAGTVVRSPVEPAQGRHLAILGETGMGKSSLLVGVAVRAARAGSLVLLDPLGETAREVRDQLGLGPDRLRFISARDPTAPTLNALEGAGAHGGIDAVRSERRLADLVHALRRVRSGRYADASFWGPRLEEMLARALRAAAAFPEGTLADAHTLLTTSGLTRRTAPPGGEEPLRELAERIRERPEDADGARRLLHEVVRNPTLARMLCARAPTIGAEEFVRPRHVVIVSGDAAEVGESTARYLLAVCLALVWSELLAAPTADKRFVLLDEAQWFAHESLSEMLRLARRRNVHTVLATQSIASLPEVVRESVWTNVADFVTFRGLPEEAREFARAAPGVPAERLLALPRGEAAVLIGKGSSVAWVRTARIPRAGAPRAPPPTTAPGSPLAGDVGPPTDADGPDPADPEEALLGWLRGRAEVEPRAFSVPLVELRARSSDGGASLRRLGARLGRAGAIRRADSDADGPVWWVDPAQLRAVGEAGHAAPGDGSSNPQPS